MFFGVIFVKVDIYQIIVIIFAIVLVAVITSAKLFPYILKLFSDLKIFLGRFLAQTGVNKKTGYAALDDEISVAGYAYDKSQDIFYSTMNAWQRKFGYCRLYDETAAVTGMIIDCEPIYFEYDDRRWMIGLWKGQYDLTTGGEIGVYQTDGPDLNIPGVFNGTFFYCAEDKDRLYIQFVLKKNSKKLFTRKGKHWWMTGFKLAEFSEPSELTMDINITLKDKKMRNAFINGLRNAGYKDKDITVNGKTVSFVFNKPYTPQPITRTEITDRIIQRKNEELCEILRDIISANDSMTKKIEAIHTKAPEVYRKLSDMGRNKESFEKFEEIKSYLEQEVH